MRIGPQFGNAEAVLPCSASSARVPSAPRSPLCAVVVHKRLPTSISVPPVASFGAYLVATNLFRPLQGVAK
jgi:hypothetical protein